MTIIIKEINRLSSGNISSLNITLSAESINTFRTILDRALNCWPHCPNEWKELSDMLNHGRVLQNYQAVHPELLPPEPPIPPTSPIPHHRV